MSPYFDGCYFDPAYFDASVCAPASTGGHPGRKIGRNVTQRIAISIPVPNDEEDDLLVSGVT